MSKILISNQSLKIHNQIFKTQTKQEQKADNTEFINRSNISLPAYFLRAQFASSYRTGAVSFKSSEAAPSFISSEFREAIRLYGNTGLTEISDLLAESKGKIFIVSGPSASGKGTLLNMLQEENNPQIAFTKSVTTRQVTTDPADKKYQQVNEEEFLNMLKNRELLECTTRHNNGYGTRLDTVKEDLSNGRSIVFEMDVTGAKTLKENLPEGKVTLIFIKPESREAQRAQLCQRNRGESPHEVEIRLNKSTDEELKQESKFDYTIINKYGEVEQAFEELKKLVLQ